MNPKEDRLARFCASEGFDGVHLRRRSNITWLTDGADTHVDLSDRLGIASVVWTPSRKFILTDNIEGARLAAEEFGSEWEIRESRWWEAPSTDRDLPQALCTDWPVDPLGPLRWSLTDLEIGRVRDLGRDGSAVMRLAMHRVAPGWSEHRLAAEIIGPLRALNIHTPVMLIASDERLLGFRHPIPTDKPINRIVMAAICAQRFGLTVSLTRLVSFAPLDADRRARHEAVCAVDAALHNATRPGATWCDVLAVGIEQYARVGFADEWHKHHQGGPMGYELRDFKATPTETRRVADRQLVGWNPSITGTKSEDTILVTAAGPEVVTGTSDWPQCHGRPDILVRSI